ncbi:hypothetical protein DH2020_042515 [Rehmannia glutinosa]|uniref:J domain-containing protein n=1 Tax=Rehmannia glutinosa TaxID=99300 RepID=A0ABR0UM72_REHGL
MDCNKDEAIRAKELSEKLLERDIKGAKKFAAKAQCLYPILDGLSQFLEIIDVYVAHEKKINGEADYYGIFGVDPFADVEILRKKYKRMALSLHPDKNKSVGADGAFKILSEAWSVLSDNEKRTAYNMKLNILASNQTGSFGSPSARYTATATDPQRVPTRPRTPGMSTSQPYTWAPHHPRNTPSGASRQHTSAAKAAGSEYNPAPRYPAPCHPAPHPHQPFDPTAGTSSAHFRKDTEFIPVPPSLRNPAPPTSNQHIPSGNMRYAPFRYQTTFSPRPSRLETFWTLCNGCRIQYEYPKRYLNQNLLCDCCKVPFLAREMPPPKVKSSSSRPWRFPRHQQDLFAGSSGSRSVPASAPFQPSDELLKSRHEGTVNMTRDNDALKKNSSTIPEEIKTASASDAVSGLNKEKAVKKRRTNVQKNDSAGEGMAGSRSGIKRPSANLKRNFGAKEESRSVKDFSQAESRVMMMGKAKTEILGLVNELEAEKPKSSRMKRVETEDYVSAGKNDAVNQVRTEQSREETDDTDANPDDTVSMSVPDANFHNFDEDRIEVSFSENQVWAAYDDDDGMPRYYALVHHVISRKPFKMQISWLNSKSSSEFGSLDWIGSGFTKTSGDFRVGKSVVSKRLNSFSHQVKWKKGTRGAIQVFPTKGDVWAMYRNWSSDWDHSTTDEIIHKYDLVVVLEDYNEDVGVLIAPLFKVAGFTSVFNLDQRESRTIPREQMFRFSHQVPFYMLNGLEAENVPKGCYELDPAALPLELLKVITDAEPAEERVSEHPVTLRGSEVESTSAGTTHALGKRKVIDDVKNFLTYSRKKGRRVARDVD